MGLTCSPKLIVTKAGEGIMNRRTNSNWKVRSVIKCRLSHTNRFVQLFQVDLQGDFQGGQI